MKENPHKIIRGLGLDHRQLPPPEPGKNNLLFAVALDGQSIMISATDSKGATAEFYWSWQDAEEMLVSFQDALAKAGLIRSGKLIITPGPPKL